MTMTTQSAIREIEALYGIDEDTGQRLLLRLVAEMRFDALSEPAIVRLAEMHRAEEERQLRAVLRKYPSAGEVLRR